MPVLVLALILSVCRPWTENVQEREWALSVGECYEPEPLPHKTPPLKPLTPAEKKAVRALLAEALKTGGRSALLKAFLGFECSRLPETYLRERCFLDFPYPMVEDLPLLPP